MANEKNLEGHGFHELTAREQREIASKAGKASVKARRRKKEFRAVIEQALNTTLPSEKAQEKLEDLGFDPTFQSAIALKVVEKAMAGNLRAAELINSIDSNKKDSLDKKEQRERIKRLELENQKLRALLSTSEGQDEKISAYLELVKGEVVSDE